MQINPTTSVTSLLPGAPIKIGRVMSDNLI